MYLFSISQLEQFSGIKSHTIRIWEQRYNALHPGRTDGNTRFYDNSQLRRLLNIVSLLQSGYKVSEVCAMTDEKLFILIRESHNSINNKSVEYFVLQFIAAGMGYDELLFLDLLSQCVLCYGMKDTYIKVIYPLLVRIGLMWTSDDILPSFEHFITNIIRQKLCAAIDSLPPAKSTLDVWLLFQPENEFHEIGLLLSNYLIRLSGKKVIYLGSNVPLNSLTSTVKDASPGKLLSFLVHSDFSEHTQKYIDKLSVSFSSKKMYIAGSQKLISQLQPPKNIGWLYSIEDLEEVLAV